MEETGGLSSRKTKPRSDPIMGLRRTPSNVGRNSQYDYTCDQELAEFRAIGPFRFAGDPNAATVNEWDEA